MAKAKGTKRIKAGDRKKYVHFNFYIEGMSEEQASMLFDVVCSVVGSHKLSVVGSFELLSDNEIAAINDREEKELAEKLQAKKS